MVQSKDNRRFLVALLLALFIHLLFMVFLLFHKELKRQQILMQTPSQTPVSFYQDEVQMPYTSASEMDQDVVQALQKDPFPLPEPSAFEQVALIPGASSEKTIIDADPMVTEASQEQDSDEQKEAVQNELAIDAIDDASVDGEIEVSQQPIAAENLMPSLPQGLFQEQSDSIQQSTLGSDRLEKTGEGMQQQQDSLGQDHLGQQRRVAAQRQPSDLSIKPQKKRAALPIIYKRKTHSVPGIKNVIEGFTQYMNEQGNNAHLERAGSRHGTFDMQEAKLLSYYTKVVSFFKNSGDQFPSYVQRAVEAFARKNPSLLKLSVYVHLVITENGGLERVIIVESSGVPEYDDFIVKKFQHAAPYPPLPKHLGKKELLFPIGVYVLLQAPPQARYFL